MADSEQFDKVTAEIQAELAGKTTPREMRAAAEKVRSILLQLCNQGTDVTSHLLAMLTQNRGYTPEQLGFTKIVFGGVPVFSYALDTDLIQFDSLPGGGYRHLRQPPSYPT